MGNLLNAVWISDILHCMGGEKSATAVKNAQVQEKKWITKRCHLIEVSYTYEFSL